MESGKESYEVQIAGLALRLKSSHDRATVSELIQLVNDKVEQAMKANPQCSFQKALLLTALHIAEELVLLKRSARRELDDLESKAKRILSDLESSPLAQNRLSN